MRRRTPILLITTLAVAALAAGATSGLLDGFPARSAQAEDEAPPAKKGIFALDWLAGQWVGGTEANGLEATYTTPRGGEIASATKSFRRGRTVFFEYERFFEREGKLILNPYPGGRKSVEFVLGGFDPKFRKARFSNEKHDFPRHVTYERTGEKTLRITLEGLAEGKPETLVLELRRP